VKVNCAALPENLIESELFGYEKGAFTGAVRPKPGRFQLAHGGTIFLDEITEIPFPLQSKLLQVLEQREFVRVGGTRTIRVDCRCIAATNANMDQALEMRSFREDLYFRMNEFSVHLPALRERREDIPLLIDYFLSLYSERYQRPRKDLSPSIIRMMMDYPWPGNVRELESLLKRMLVLDSEEIVYQMIGTPNRQVPEAGYHPTVVTQSSPQSQPQGPRQVPYGLPGFQRISTSRPSEVSLHGSPDRSGHPGQGRAPSSFQESSSQHFHQPPNNDPEPQSAVEEEVTEGAAEMDLKVIVERAIERAEREAITAALNRTKWNRRKSAQQLGISYSSLLRRIAKYNLELD
jgi:transcriptional regulator with PAS, ATPase and Fis domain